MKSVHLKKANNFFISVISIRSECSYSVFKSSVLKKEVYVPNVLYLNL